MVNSIISIVMMTSRDECIPLIKLIILVNQLLYEELYIKESCNGDILIKTFGSEHITIPKKVR